MPRMFRSVAIPAASPRDGTQFAPVVCVDLCATQRRTENAMPAVPLTGFVNVTCHLLKQRLLKGRRANGCRRVMRTGERHPPR